MLHKMIESQRKLVSGLPEIVKVEPSRRSVKDVLQKKQRCTILECKKASPSNGLIKTDYDPKNIAHSYAPFASVISVLTNTPYFGGSYEHLNTVRKLVDTPLLCKDIIVSSKQVTIARHHGADAILLMLSVLNNETYQACQQTARRLNLDVITEVHTKEEVKRALKLKANIIGINNRNLHTLNVDISTTQKLAPFIPNDIPVVSESGIQCFEDILELLPYAKNFLIGSALSKSKHLDLKVRELMFGKIKVCGLTRVDDAKAAFEAGASFGGLNFVKSSQRYLTTLQAQELISIPLNWVGVFQNSSIQEIIETAQKLSFKAVQLHGEESLSFIKDLRKRLPKGIEIWKAVTTSTIEQYQSDLIDQLVLDNLVEGQFGGTGTAITTDDLKGIEPKKVMLSGGIGAHNVLERMKISFSTFDINSTVEKAPGLKDQKLLNNFFETHLQFGA